MQEMDFEMVLHGTDETIAAFEERFWNEFEVDNAWRTQLDRESGGMRYGGTVLWNIADGLLDGTNFQQALEDLGLVAEIWGVSHDEGTLDHYVIDKGEVVLEDTCIAPYAFMDARQIAAVVGSKEVAEHEAQCIPETDLKGKRAYAIQAKEVLGREYTVIAGSLEEAKSIVLAACDEGLVNYEDGDIPITSWEVEEGDPQIPCDREVLVLDGETIHMYDDRSEHVGSAPYEIPAAVEGAPTAPGLSDVAKQAEELANQQTISPMNMERDAR